MNENRPNEKILFVDDEKNLLASYRRAANIVRIEEKKDGVSYDAAPDTHLVEARGLPEEKALDWVFGYCVLNDTTARDLQQVKHGGQWFKGKSLDGHAPMGPWIVTAQGFDPTDQHLLLRVNGVVKQDASTKQMHFKVPRLLAELSAGLTLEAGDILTTGTPPGIGHARKPPEYLKPGDVMESEISGIGVLRNPIKAV